MESFWKVSIRVSRLYILNRFTSQRNRQTQLEPLIGETSDDGMLRMKFQSD